MFSSHYNSLETEKLYDLCINADSSSVQNVLSKDELSLEDFAVLISPAAKPFLEEIAQIAQQKTRKRFGYALNLYTPLYVSNECVNSCVYCSFNHHLQIERKTLSEEEIHEECKLRHERGFEHLLLVSGEHPKAISLDYLEKSIRIAKEYFAQVSIEIYPLETNEYKRLKDAGLDGLTLYQETYNPDLYKNYHPAGPKADYTFRVNTMDRAASAGIKRLNIGSLLGLNDWRKEAFLLLSHFLYLKKKYWNTELALSFPRIRKNEGSFQPPYPINDSDLVQLIFAIRLLDEQVCLVLSSRESAEFRNGMIPIVINSVSAGSKTNPGGYAHDDGSTQFQISDERSPEEMAEFLRTQGFDPVWKDWEQGI